MYSLAPTITEMITKENYQRTNAANLKPDNVDINRHPVHVGYVVFYIYFYLLSQIFEIKRRLPKSVKFHSLEMLMKDFLEKAHLNISINLKDIYIR